MAVPPVVLRVTERQTDDYRTTHSQDHACAKNWPDSKRRDLEPFRELCRLMIQKKYGPRHCGARPCVAGRVWRANAVARSTLFQHGPDPSEHNFYCRPL